EWGRNGWKWEHFGEMVPVKNQDLWQRLDRALKIHRIHGTRLRFDAPAGCEAPEATQEALAAHGGLAVESRRDGIGRLKRQALALLRTRWERFLQALRREGTSLPLWSWVKQ